MVFVFLSDFASLSILIALQKSGGIKKYSDISGAGLFSKKRLRR